MISAIALAALVLFACDAGDRAARASPADRYAIRAATRETANALTRFYEAANDGASEAYVSRALANDTQVKRSERCRLPSGRLSTRPTVLANPLLAHSSIMQRSAIVSTIGAYDELLVTITSGDRSDLVGVRRHLLSELAKLDVVAHTHAKGDLFIEDLTRALRRRLVSVAQGNDSTQLRDVSAANPVVRKLFEILAADLTRQRVDTVDAATLAFRSWTLYPQTARDSASRTRVRNGPPFCSEPAIFARDRTPIPQTSEESTLPQGRYRDRYRRAKTRLDAVRSTNPETVLSALATLDADLVRNLSLPRSSEAADATTASISHFRTKARGFADAMKRLR